MGKFLSKIGPRESGKGLPGILVSPVLTLFILVLILLFSSGRVAFADFLDLRGHWAAGEVRKAVAGGYLKGYPDGTFRPDQHVTRVEFVTLVNGAFEIKQVTNCRVSFKDVEQGDWFFQEVAAALTTGYLNGYPDGTFRPEEYVTRQEAACALGKLLNLKGEVDLHFIDAGLIAGWARPFVAGLVAKEVITGYPGGTFCPSRSITRAEAAVMVNKLKGCQEVIPVTLVLTVVEEVVNIRSGPGTSYQIIRQVRLGDLLQARAFSDNNWYQVDYQGEVGWIAGWLVRVSQTPHPSRCEPGVLKIEVEQEEGKLAITLFGGPDASYRWGEKQNPHRLVVTVHGVTVIRTPLEREVREAGLEQIAARFPANRPGTAEVEFTFINYPLPVYYTVEDEGEGKLRITVPHQVIQIHVETTGDAVLVAVRGTAPLKYQTSTLRKPERLVFDFPGFTLHPFLRGWEKELGVPPLERLRLGQYLPGVVRLVAELTQGASFMGESNDAGHELTLKVWPAVLSARQAGLRGKRVVLDPGHGGDDPGAIGPAGLKEKDVNLAIASRVAEVLDGSGIKVVLTRQGDEGVGLKERANVANKVGAEVFVSIHANAAYNPSTGGTATYIYTASDAYLGLQRGAPLYLAQLLQEELVHALGLRNAGIFEESFAVLRYAQVPAALVEVAFISNPIEERLLADSGFQAVAADAIARAIIRFLTG